MKRVFSREVKILILLLFIAGFLRFYRLNERGLILFDEAHYLFEAGWVLSVLSNIPYLKEWTDWALGIKCVTPSCVAKPGFNLLLAGFSLIVGLRDYTGLLFSAFTSIFIILLVYWMGKRYFGRRVALYSSAFLAVMPYFLYYSRSGLPEMGFLLFFYSGIFIYLENLKKDLNWMLPLSGFLIGYSFTCSYKWFLFLPFFIGIEIWFNLKKKLTVSFKVRRALLLVLSLLLPTLLIEALYCFLGLINILPPNVPTYLEQLISHRNIVPISSLFETEDISVFGYYFLRLVGPIALLFLGVGLISSFKERSWEGIILSLILLTTIFLFGIMNSLRVPRAFSGALPAISLVMGKGLESLSHLPLKRGFLRPFLFISLLLHFLYSGMVDLDIVRFKSGYKEALSYLATQGGLRHITTSNITCFYEGPNAFYYFGKFSDDPDQAFEQLRMLHKKGFRFFLIDWMDKYWVSCFNIRLPTLPQLIQERSHPVKIFPNDIQRHWLLLYENGLKTKEVKRFSQDEKVGQILIFDLNELFEEGRL